MVWERSMKTLTQLQAAKAKLESEVAELEKSIQDRKREFAKLTPAHELAEELHGLLCRGNHTDGCSWGYENWSELGQNAHSVKGRYLSMAKEALRVTDMKTVLGVIEAIRNNQ